MGDVETLTWAGIYSQGWGRGLLSPGAFSHPAKFAYGLLIRLYDHGFERGWWAKGSLVADPFGGVGCGGVVAAYRGLRWVGCELEPRFIALAEETFALHRGKWAAAGDTPPVIVQGDSRNFAALVAAASACVTSPPYADTGSHGNMRTGAVDCNSWADGRPRKMGPSMNAEGYGTTPGQLGGLPVGDADGVITSPPYAEGCAQTGGADLHPERFHGGNHPPVLRGYGDTPGNVGNLPAGDAGAVVTSPPYEGSNVSALDPASASGGQGNAFRRTGKGPRARDAMVGEDYGTAPGQVGALRQETYWDAVRCIYGQAYLSLKPSGIMAVVVKDFVRARRRVPLCDQTWRLLLSLGFRPVERIRCLLAEETREPSLFGGDCVTRTERASFFRRLATKKGAPAIDFEEILVARRP